MVRLNTRLQSASTLGLIAALASLAACVADAPGTSVEEIVTVSEKAPVLAPGDVTIHPELWPALVTPALDPSVEARIDGIMAKMTLEQKVGQVIFYQILD